MFYMSDGALSLTSDQDKNNFFVADAESRNLSTESAAITKKSLVRHGRSQVMLP